jgi:hypothetical protein
MLQRPPACCRAVQRQLRPPSDSIWVSDTLLLSIFQSFFVISRAARRHGSFVPGPLESRRRLGKRRMAHLSEAMPPPTHGLTELWGWFGETDGSRWQWEAPTTRPPKPEHDASLPPLPAWLSEWNASPEEDASPSAIEASSKNLTGEITFGMNELVEFQSNIQNARLGQRHQICLEFNQRLHQNLTIGIVDGSIVYSALQIVTKAIRKGFPDSTLAESYMLDFYQTLWGGITACKVLRPTDFHSSVMDRLVSLLSDLPISLDVQVLAHSILTSSSIRQLREMSSIRRLVLQWSRTWLEEQLLVDPGPSLAMAEQTVLDAGKDLMQAHELVMSLDPTSSQISNAHEFLSHAKEGILEGIATVKSAENILLPHQASIMTLADALGKLSPGRLAPIIRSCSDQIVNFCKSTEGSLELFRYHWLSLLARLPNTDTARFRKAWQNLETCKGPLREDLSSDLLLSHWISQGYLPEADTIRNSFEASVERYGGRDFGSLLFTVQKHGENCWTRATDLFQLLGDVGRYKSTYRVLSRTKSLGVKAPPVDFIRQTLSAMSDSNPRLALKIYNMYVPTVYNVEQMRLYWCSKFLLAMIHDGRVPPNAIWKTLGIPIYSELRKHELPGRSSKPLRPAMIDLLTKMAEAFAHSDARPQRVAFRNVLQCIYHLRRHGAPITPSLARAITHAGITREVNRENWVGSERLRWALRMVEEAEGTAVAQTVDRAVYHWRQAYMKAQAKSWERRKVLHVGPID